MPKSLTWLIITTLILCPIQVNDKRATLIMKRKHYSSKLYWINGRNSNCNQTSLGLVPPYCID